MVTVTEALGDPMLGLITVMTGVPGVTLKPLLRFTFSLLVATEIVRLPTEALAAMVMLAINCVVLFTVTKFTVIPEPKLTEEKPCWKVVNCPVTVTFTVAPACPLAGALLGDFLQGAADGRDEAAHAVLDDIVDGAALQRLHRVVLSGNHMVIEPG